MCRCTYAGTRHNYLTFALLWLVALSGIGCVGPKRLVYFQNLPGQAETVLPKLSASVIQPGDLLAVEVSSLNPEASAFFNPYAAQLAVQPNFNLSTTPLPPAIGYTVAVDSTITLPLIGKTKVAGLTSGAAADRIHQKLNAYLKEPTVNVRNLNFRVTVLGEVARPALFNIAGERITLPQALGLAGDLTIYGRRDNVLVVREENGQRTYARLDLTRPDVFQSPYYHLHANDVVYVEPGRARVASTNPIYQVVPILLSALSFVAIIVTNR